MLLLFILIMLTCFFLAIVAVTVGQALVRRHHAQMVVDAAALSGAAAQARGMNTIARWNQKSLHFLQAIQLSNALPYVDSDATTNARMGIWLLCPPCTPLYNDWAHDVLEGYQSIFDLFNTVIELTNRYYSVASPMPGAPRQEAAEVIDLNFGDDSMSLFREADLHASGTLVPVEDLGGILELVKLTDATEYQVAPYYYVFNPSNWALQTCSLPFPADIPCLELLATYATMDGYTLFLSGLIDPINYELGRFYDNDAGKDVRFAYYLKLSQSPVLFGKNFFNDIPPILVAAAAKPHGGHLGDEFEAMWDFDINVGPYGEQDGKEISYTYVPKLVPLKPGEKLALAALNAEFDDPLRWVGILH